ncbi:hypothetical protein ACFL6Y_07515 [Elusimicrobiota bacterium]
MVQILYSPVTPAKAGVQILCPNKGSFLIHSRKANLYKIVVLDPGFHRDDGGGVVLDPGFHRDDGGGVVLDPGFHRDDGGGVVLDPGFHRDDRKKWDDGG